MAWRFALFPMAFFGLVLSLQTEAQAVVYTNLTMACTNTSRLQTRIDAVAAGAVGTITITSGTCVENIYVPEGKTIFVVGSAINQGVVLTPASALSPTVYSEGFVQFRNVTIRSTSGTAPVAQADNGGTFSILASSVTASTAPRVLSAFNNSTIRIRNSSVSTTAPALVQDKVINVDQSSSLLIFGTSNAANGPGGGPNTVITGGKDAIYCGGNSSTSVISEGTGTVTLQNSTRVFNLNSCSLVLDNQTSTPSNLLVRNATGAGITTYNSDVMLKGPTIAANRNGIYSVQSRTVIVGTVFGGAAGANTTDIKSDVGSSIEIDDFGGQTSFPNLGESTFRCVNGGEIYYYPDFVVQDLSSYEGSCLREQVY